MIDQDVSYHQPSFTDDLGHEPYRPRKHSDRPSSHKNLDPYTLNHIVPFTYFCDWYKQTNARTLSKNTEISKDEIQESFIKYRDDLIARTSKDFVKEHMSEVWFKEKYDPVLGPTTRAKLIEYRKWLYQNFMQDLDAGKFDELTLDGAAGNLIRGILTNDSTEILCRENHFVTKFS
jgi:SERRATE/Ars2, N-terminal domain